MADKFEYSSFDNNAAEDRLRDNIATWEREHFGNSTNLRLAKARMDAAWNAGDEDAHKAAKSEAEAAWANVQQNEAAILEARAQLAALKKATTGPKATAKPSDPVIPPPVPDIPGVTSPEA